MEPWRSVRLTRARQVGELMDVPAAQMPAADVPVREHYQALRQTDPVAALEFISHALPRHEAIYWAAGLLGSGDAADAAGAALTHVRNWLDDPTEASRRSAYAAAQALDLDAPERTLATALFYSGGSIAAAAAPPIQPEPGLANQLAVTAVIQAAYRSGDAQRFFATALARAETIADDGMPARP